MPRTFTLEVVEEDGTVSKAYGILAEAATPPEVPTQLTVDELTAAIVQLSWNDDGAVTVSTIYRDGAPIGTSATQTYADLTVEPSTAYSYQVQATNAGGSSALSAALPVTTPANTAPEWALGDITASINSGYILDLTSVCFDVDGHALVFTMPAGSVPGVTISGHNLSGVPTTVGNYPITLDAFDGYAHSQLPITFRAVDPDVTAPTVPAGVVASANGSSATITWNASTDASGISRYRVFWKPPGQASFTFRGSPTPLTGLSFSESGLAPGDYSWKVSAVDNSANLNESAQSAAASVTIQSQSPDAPVNLRVTGSGVNSLSLAFEPGPSGATPTGYVLQRSPNGTTNFVPVEEYISPNLTGVDGGLTEDTNYYYRVRATASGVDSPWSAVVTGRTGSANRNLFYEATYSTGRLWPIAVGQADGAVVRCLPTPQPSGGKQVCLTPSDGFAIWNNFAANSVADFKVVQQETWNGVTVTPRPGNTHFLRAVIYNNKNYLYIDPAKNKPRGDAGPADNPGTCGAAAAVECWVGFSIYIHPDYWHDSRNEATGGQQFAVWKWSNDASNIAWELNHQKKAAENFQQWVLKPTGGVGDLYLGDVTPSIGKWTDFVINWKEAANGTGFIKCWKGVAQASGDRVLVEASPAVSRTGINLGQNLASIATRPRSLHIRLYKWNWIDPPNTQPSTPLYYGFDEVRLGFVNYRAKQATDSGFSDVCPGGVVTDPPPPPDPLPVDGSRNDPPGTQYASQTLVFTDPDTGREVRRLTTDGMNPGCLHAIRDASGMEANSFSRNNSEIAYTKVGHPRKPDGVYKQNLSSGAETYLAPIGGRNRGVLAWSKTENKIFYHRESGNDVQLRSVLTEAPYTDALLQTWPGCHTINTALSINSDGTLLASMCTANNPGGGDRLVFNHIVSTANGAIYPNWGHDAATPDENPNNAAYSHPYWHPTNPKRLRCWRNGTLAIWDIDSLNAAANPTFLGQAGTLQSGHACWTVDGAVFYHAGGFGHADCNPTQTGLGANTQIIIEGPPANPYLYRCTMAELASGLIADLANLPDTKRLCHHYGYKAGVTENEGHLHPHYSRDAVYALFCTDLANFTGATQPPGGWNTAQNPLRTDLFLVPLA